LRDRGGEETQIGNRTRNIQTACKRQRFAAVARLGGGEFVQARFDLVGDAVQNLGALRCGCRRSCRKRT